MYVSCVKPSHTSPVFNFSCFGGTEARKSCQNQNKLFFNHKNCATNCLSMFRVPNGVNWGQFSTLAATVLPVPGKVVKIWPKHFFAVVIGHDKNCIPKSGSMFRSLNRVIWPHFQLFLLRWCLGPTKSWKLVRDRFYPYRWETTRNASQIEYIYSGCQNWVIRSRFSTFPAAVGPGSGKVVKIRTKQFLDVPMGNDKICTPKSVPMFQELNWVIWTRF